MAKGGMALHQYVANWLFCFHTDLTSELTLIFTVFFVTKQTWYFVILRLSSWYFYIKMNFII